jgi:hypothetical protein
VNTSDSCLDAETLAAWVDGGLSGAELQVVQAHVADCARCQALVGAMARTDSAVPPSEAPHRSRRWLAWAVPLTAAATAVLIWTTMPRNSVTPATVTSESARPAAEEPPAPEVVAEPQLIPEKSEAAAESKPATPPPPQRADTRDQLSERVAVASPQEATAQQANKDIAAAAPPAPAAAPAAARAQSTLAAAAAARNLCGPNSTIAPPGVTTPLNAGASPSANVCWIVGRLGVVLLTTDGRTWRGITFPVIADLSSVTATDARNATVMTTDGRAFTTVDGGMTWTAK